jgi:hypothetical protein
MKTNTDPAAAWAALAPFAPEMFDALRAITHPMASDEDLQDALALLAEINAARKAASDSAFIKATAVDDIIDFVAYCKGKLVWHGSPSYESPEIVSGVEDRGDHVEIEFESGAFTNVRHADLATFIRSGRAAYRRAGSGSLAGAHESLALRSC